MIDKMTESNVELVAQLREERDVALQENCKLINELLGYQYDVKKLHETVQYMQHTISLLNNDTLRLKSRLEERDDSLHEKSQKVSYLESELKKLKTDQDKIYKVSTHLSKAKNFFLAKRGISAAIQSKN